MWFHPLYSHPVLPTIFFLNMHAGITDSRKFMTGAIEANERDTRSILLKPCVVVFEGFMGFSCAQECVGVVKDWIV